MNIHNDDDGADGMRSLLAAAMGLTRLGASTSPPAAAAADAAADKSKKTTTAVGMPADDVTPGGVLQSSSPSLKSKSSEEVDAHMPSKRQKINQRSWAAPSSEWGGAQEGQEQELSPDHNMIKGKGPNKDKITLNFPEILYEIISNTEENEDIIAWLPNGKGFYIHDKNKFATQILPRHFDGAKFTSFTRRLKRWGFERVAAGAEMGAYYNKYFARGRHDLVGSMVYGTGAETEGKDEAKKVDGKKAGEPSSKKLKNGDKATANRKGTPGGDKPKKQQTKKLASKKQVEEAKAQKSGSKRKAGSDAEKIPKAKVGKTSQEHKDDAVVAAAMEVHRKQRQLEEEKQHAMNTEESPPKPSKDPQKQEQTDKDKYQLEQLEAQQDIRTELEMQDLLEQQRALEQKLKRMPPVLSSQNLAGSRPTSRPGSTTSYQAKREQLQMQQEFNRKQHQTQLSSDEMELETKYQELMWLQHQHQQLEERQALQWQQELMFQNQNKIKPPSRQGSLSPGMQLRHMQMQQMQFGHPSMYGRSDMISMAARQRHFEELEQLERQQQMLEQMERRQRLAQLERERQQRSSATTQGMKVNEDESLKRGLKQLEELEWLERQERQLEMLERKRRGIQGIKSEGDEPPDGRKDDKKDRSMMSSKKGQPSPIEGMSAERMQMKEQLKHAFSIKNPSASMPSNISGKDEEYTQYMRKMKERQQFMLSAEMELAHQQMHPSIISPPENSQQQQCLNDIERQILAEMNYPSLLPNSNRGRYNPRRAMGNNNMRQHLPSSYRTSQDDLMMQGNNARFVANQEMIQKILAGQQTHEDIMTMAANDLRSRGVGGGSLPGTGPGSSHRLERQNGRGMMQQQHHRPSSMQAAHTPMSPSRQHTMMLRELEEKVEKETAAAVAAGAAGGALEEMPLKRRNSRASAA